MAYLVKNFLVGTFGNDSTQPLLAVATLRNTCALRCHKMGCNSKKARSLETSEFESFEKFLDRQVLSLVDPNSVPPVWKCHEIVLFEQLDSPQVRFLKRTKSILKMITLFRKKHSSFPLNRHNQSCFLVSHSTKSDGVICMSMWYLVFP